MLKFLLFWLSSWLMLSASAARADEPRWWLLAGEDAVFPVGARELPAVAKDGSTVLAFSVRNDRSYALKCDFEAVVDASDGDDVVTETIPLHGKVLAVGQGSKLHAPVFDEDMPEGYHLVLGSQRLVGTCLGLKDGTDAADAPTAESLCTAVQGCLDTCQAAEGDGKVCASSRVGWGEGRFLQQGEGTSAGPAVALDLYGNGAGTTAALYLGMKTEARVCAGSFAASYGKGADAATDARSLDRKVLRAGRSFLLAAQGGRERAEDGWTLSGGEAEIFCMPYTGDVSSSPDPEAAYRRGGEGAERFTASASVFTIHR